MHSDTEILNLIEDFLVNNFGDDERRKLDGDDAAGMLDHVVNLIELRNPVMRSASVNRKG